MEPGTKRQTLKPPESYPNPAASMDDGSGIVLEPPEAVDDAVPSTNIRGHGNEEPKVSGLSLLNHMSKLAWKLTLKGQIGLIVEGRNEKEASQDPGRVRSHEGAPLDSLRYVGRDEMIIDSLRQLTSADKLRFLASLDHTRLRMSLAYIDHKLLGQITNKASRDGLYTTTSFVTLTAAQAEHASYVELSFPAALHVTSILPNPSWHIQEGQVRYSKGLISRTANASNSPVPSMFSPIAVPRKYASIMRRNLEEAIVNSAPSFEVPYNRVTFPLSGYRPRLHSTVELSAPVTDYAAAGLRSFEHVQQSISTSAFARQHGIRISAPEMQPFGGDAELLQDDHPDIELEFKEGLLSEESDHMVYSQRGDATEKERMRTSPWNPFRTHHYTLIFDSAYTEVWCVPSSEIRNEWWSGDERVLIEKEVFDRFHIQTSGADWIEEMYLIMDEFPDRLPRRKYPPFSNEYAELYTAAAFRLAPDGDDEYLDTDDDFGSDPADVAERGVLKLDKVSREASIRSALDALNRVCAAHRRGVALSTGVLKPGLPNAVFYPGYVWSEEDYQAFISLNGTLPVHLHTGSIDPLATLIPIRWSAVISRFLNQVGFSRNSTINALAPLTCPHVFITRWTSPSMRDNLSSSLGLLSEQIATQDLFEKVADLVDVESSISLAALLKTVARKCRGNHLLLRDVYRCTSDLEGLVGDHLQKFQVPDGQGTYDFLMKLDAAHMDDVKIVRWISSNTEILASDCYLVRFHELLQIFADYHAPRWFGAEESDGDGDDDDDGDDGDDGEDGGNEEGAKSKARNTKAVPKAKKPKAAAKPKQPKAKKSKKPKKPERSKAASKRYSDDDDEDEEFEEEYEEEYEANEHEYMGQEEHEAEDEDGDVVKENGTQIPDFYQDYEPMDVEIAPGKPGPVATTKEAKATAKPKQSKAVRERKATGKRKGSGRPPKRCIECRKGHRKCGMEHPSCAGCVKMHRECIYDDDDGLGEKPTRAQYHGADDATTLLQLESQASDPRIYGEENNKTREDRLRKAVDQNYEAIDWSNNLGEPR